MNGTPQDMDAAIVAQRERLAKKAVAPAVAQAVAADQHATPSGAAPKATKDIYELRVTVREDGTANIVVPDSKDQFMQLIQLAVSSAIETAAKAGYNVGAEAAVNAFIANPNISPVTWFRKTFGRDPSNKSDQVLS